MYPAHPRFLRFLSRLAVAKDVAASAQNQEFSALLFRCRDLLDVRLEWLDGEVRAKRPKRLPVLECLELRDNDVDFGYRQITMRGMKKV